MPPDVTALLPIHRLDGNREWLQQAVNSLGPNVVPLVLENDGNVTEALNAGLQAADTEWVLPFGADDIAAPDMVHELHAAAWDVDVAYPAMTLVDETLTVPMGEHEAGPFCPWRLLQGNFVTGNSLIRRTKALEVGGYRDLESLEDWDLFVRMSKAGARFKAVPLARMFYRQVPGSRNRRDTIDWQGLHDQIIGTDDLTRDLAATFYAAETPATTYLRCTLPARHLPGLVLRDWSLAYKPDGTHEFPNHRGTAVFQLAASKTIAAIGGQMLEDGTRVLVETDDNYLAGGTTRFRKNSNWGRNIGDMTNSVAGHRSIIEKCSGVIVTTDYLASQYRKVNANVYVCPNQVDPQDWQPLAKPDDGVFRVGWFASQSHAGDEVLIARAMEWCSRQPNVEVVTLGYRPRWNFKFTALPWVTDLSGWRKMMQYLDVGLCPVIPTPFTRGRSDLKWLETTMGGAAAVVSDMDSYKTVPDNLAIKAKDAVGFYKAVRGLVENRDDAKQMAAEARAHVLKERTVKANIHLWREAVAA